jgi:hypothetical protein
MAASTEEPLLHYARLGEDGEPCHTCGTPLDADQRYCLECGARRGDARLPFENYLGTIDTQTVDAPPPEAPVPTAVSRANDPSPIAAVVGVALLGLTLLIGVLLGRGGDDSGSQTPVVLSGDAATAATSGDTSGGSSAPVSDTKVTSEWPDGKNGWTVELGTLPKDGTTAADVDATKKDLESKGASDVGVLDSDLYASLPAGNYIVYSGVYDSKADADKALKDLSGIPDAQVVEVSDQKPSSGGSDGGGGSLLSGNGGGGGGGGGEKPVEASTEDLEALENTTGDDYQDQINNIPDEIATPGEAPPDDPSVEPGGDSADDPTIIK